MSLRHYLQLAYKEVRLSSVADLTAIEHLDRTLYSDRENLLLVYGGSFNPPHRGHIDVLLSGLRPEINAVATVILPSEDYHLRNKVANCHPEFFLERKRRADIWGALPSIPKTRVWVWTNTWYPFGPFVDALLRLTAADGYKLVFSNMIGPDNLRLNEPLLNPPYSFSTILVTNKARHVSAHFLPDGKPAIWKGFGDWSRTGSHAEDGKEVVHAEAVLWTCTGLKDHEKRGYYLQYKQPAFTDINSTSLRQVFVQRYRVDEGSLNQRSTEALILLLSPILLDN